MPVGVVGRRGIDGRSIPIEDHAGRGTRQRIMGARASKAKPVQLNARLAAWLSASRPALTLWARCTTQQSAAVLAQHANVAASLDGFNDREANVPHRDLKINAGVGGDLQNNAAVRARLVGLSGRMQKARAEAQAGRHVLVRADPGA